MLLSVIIPAHNPEPNRLRAVLGGLAVQTLPSAEWETILVDNASVRWPEEVAISCEKLSSLRVVREPALGLANARRAGLLSARADVAVFVDDDNVLAPDYLQQALAFLDRRPAVGAVGGKSVPSFDAAPEPWTQEFFPLLGLRDLGENEIVSANTSADENDKNRRYPDFAPIGAGMVLRRPAWQAWLAATKSNSFLTDRRGNALSSAGDNEIVLCAMKAGWQVAYSPMLRLTHLIPPTRLQRAYLARLNRGIQRSWIQVLMMHGACPWTPITRPGAALRKLKAYFRHRPWQSAASHVRWQGACGHFDGRADRLSAIAHR